MTLDEALVSPVSHYIGGMIGAALVTHSEIEVRGKLPELLDTITQAKKSCQERCQGILVEPAKYAKLPDYQLKPDDRSFLQALLGKIEQSNWENLAEVQKLSNFVDDYLPKGNLLR